MRIHVIYSVYFANTPLIYVTQELSNMCDVLAILPAINVTRAAPTWVQPRRLGFGGVIMHLGRLVWHKQSLLICFWCKEASWSRPQGC